MQSKAIPCRFYIKINAEGKTADIYTLDGRLVASHLCSSADRLSVQKGAYLVKVLGNTTKVIVY
ncbi:MAG: T9SS C-terminal target domain-containing protein [Bacteroidales bacterium]|nr:T9SS C-terminal target domain-containing protein [Bacteroidales bacterium]